MPQQQPPQQVAQQQQAKASTPNSAKKQPVASKPAGKQIQRRGSKTTITAAQRRGSKTAKPDGPSAKTSEPTYTEGHLSLKPTTASTSRSSSKKSAPKTGSGPHVAPLVGPRIADLVKSIDPNYGIDPDAEEQVLQLADDFLEKVTKQAMRLAQHRGSKTLDVRDLQIVLAKNFGIVVPGLGLPVVRPIKGASVTSKTSSSSSSSKSSSKRSSSAMGDSSGPVRKKANTSQGGTGTAGGTSVSA